MLINLSYCLILTNMLGWMVLVLGVNAVSFFPRWRVMNCVYAGAVPSPNINRNNDFRIWLNKRTKSDLGLCWEGPAQAWTGLWQGQKLFCQMEADKIKSISGSVKFSWFWVLTNVWVQLCQFSTSRNGFVHLTITWWLGKRIYVLIPDLYLWIQIVFVRISRRREGWHDHGGEGQGVDPNRRFFTFRQTEL